MHFFLVLHLLKTSRGCCALLLLFNLFKKPNENIFEAFPLLPKLLEVRAKVARLLFAFSLFFIFDLIARLERVFDAKRSSAETAFLGSNPGALDNVCCKISCKVSLENLKLQQVTLVYMRCCRCLLFNA